MRYLGIVAACVLSGGIACSGNSPITIGSSPRTGVVTTGPGTVVTTGERSTAATLGIPPGHLPAPGLCRVWQPGQPPGQQRRLPNGSCDVVERQVRPGQWLVYRPGENKKIVEVRTYGSSGSGTVIRLIRVFDVATGVLLSESNR